MRTNGRYEIRLKGHLDSRWTTWFDGLTLTNESDGTTVLQGPVVDQAALYGLLHKVRDIGLPLVSVTQVDTDEPSRARAHQPRPIAKRETDMTTTVRTAAPTRVPMDSTRKTSLVAGILYLITFVSIPALAPPALSAR